MPATSTRRTAVFVVHGVGSPQAGETVDALTHSLVARYDDLHLVRQELVPLPDYRTRLGREQRSFPCHVRRLRRGDHEMAFFEVCWARAPKAPPIAVAAIELTRAWLGFLVGLRTIFFASRDRQAPAPARALHAIASLASLALIGPVYAMNALLLVAFAVHLLDETFGWIDALAPLLTTASALITAAIGVWRLERIGARLRADGLVGRIRLALTTDYVPPRRPLWACMAVFGIGFAIDFAVVGASWETCAWHTGTILLLAFGCAVLAMTAAIALYSFVRLSRIAAEHTPRLQAVTVCGALQLGLWVTLVPTLWWTLVQVTGNPLSTEMIRRVLATDGAQWVLGIPVVLTGIATWLAFRRSPCIRLILPGLGSWVLLIATVLGGAAFVHAATRAEGFEWLDFKSHADALHLTGRHGMMFAVLVLASTLIRTGLGLADDVLNYLQKYTARRELLEDHPIRSRFRRVVEHVHENETFDEVLIVAHSQGTVIAIDELGARDADDRRPFRRPISARTQAAYDAVFAERRATLVTAGSPFEHLYQHYFPQHYPPLDDERWSPLRSRIHRWHNLYRTHDYVGRRIEPGAARPDFPQNEPLGEGGHVGYWSDIGFLARLDALIHAGAPTERGAPAERA